MTAPATPDQIELLIAGYVLGDLSPEEADTFEQLLQDRPDLWEAVADIQTALEQTFPVEEQAPPTYLKQSILSAAQVLQQTVIASDREAAKPALLASTVATTRPDPTQVIAFSRWQRGLGAAAAIVIVGLGISNWLLWQSLQSLQASRRTTDNPLVFTLERTPLAPTSDASVRVVVDPRDLEATLDIKNLPPLAEGEVYVLWTVVKPDAPVTADAKGAILTQVFQVDAQGRLTQRIPVPAVFRDRNLVKAVAITVENAKAPQKHLAKPILIQRI